MSIAAVKILRERNELRSQVQRLQKQLAYHHEKCPLVARDLSKSVLNSQRERELADLLAAALKKVRPFVGADPEFNVGQYDLYNESLESLKAALAQHAALRK